MVSSLILIAPAGLQRHSNITWTSKLLYSTRWFPESWLQYLVKTRLSGSKPTGKSTTPNEPEVAEVPMQERPGSFDRAILSRSRPGVTVASVVVSLYFWRDRALRPKADFGPQAWQIDSHRGFIKSFMSSIRHGPIYDQHSQWQRIGERLNLQKASRDRVPEEGGLQNGQVLIILGDHDPIIVEDELVEDASEVLGWENVRVEVCNAGHELAITDSEHVVHFIWKFWGEK